MAETAGIHQISSKRPRILVVYFVSRDNRIKYLSWRDGFVAAMKLLESNYDVEWHNLADRGLETVNMKDYSAIFVKGNWQGHVDLAVRSLLADESIPRALLISGTRPAPSLREMSFYQVLFYETDWYRPQIGNHPRIVHAFGIDTDVMKPPAKDAEKTWDWMTVGSLWMSRLDLLTRKKGSKLAVLYAGPVWRGWPSIARLGLRGVRVQRSVPYEDLAGYYYTARRVYVPTDLSGGGERAVLEARACGTPVEVEMDNPKLMELLESPIWDHRYYARQLTYGLELLLNGAS